MNLFEKATRMKLRFETALGSLLTEDLWDLPLTSKIQEKSLDDLAKKINKIIRERSEESFVDKKSSVNEELSIKFSIVKHIIAVRLEERDLAKKAADRKATKEKIMALIAEKQDETLRGKSVTSLKKMLADLD